MEVEKSRLSTPVKRKLTTILAADVESFTRLMRENEEATLGTLSEYREVIDDLIERHDGRIFSTAGDSVLAEFGSTVEAVRCAIAFQEEVADRNTELPAERRLTFRIGLNVGDVMAKGDALYGDVINVAARLEGLADSGGICISAAAFEQVKHKLSLGFEDMGAHMFWRRKPQLPCCSFCSARDASDVEETRSRILNSTNWIWLQASLMAGILLESNHRNAAATIIPNARVFLAGIRKRRRFLSGFGWISASGFLACWLTEIGPGTNRNTESGSSRLCEVRLTSI